MLKLQPTKNMKSLRRVFACRHATDDRKGRDPQLTDSGKQEASVLAEAIAGILSEDGITNVVVLHSSLSRARQTAEIVAAALEPLVSAKTQLECLTEDQYEDGSRVFPKIMLEIGDETQAVIAVSHYELPSGIIDAFSNNFVSRKFPAKQPPYGCGFSLCLQTGDVIRIP
jgi:phosphohistidine phosphatase SixA